MNLSLECPTCLPVSEGCVRRWKTCSSQSETVRPMAIVLIWAETGGPPVPEHPPMRGFGSMMMQMNLAGELAGTIEYDWQATGLVATLRLSQAALPS